MLRMSNVTHIHCQGTPLQTTALRNVSLRLHPGDFACVVGPNGSGKSSLLGIVSGVHQPVAGSVSIAGRIVNGLPHHRRAADIGMVFQNPLQGTCPSMTVEENLALACLRGKPYGLSWLLAKHRRSQLRERLAQLALGLEDRLHSRVGLLSGGQRQALTLLMATLARPKLLLLDEHTAALDPATAERVIQLTRDLVGQQGLTTLMVTHSLEQALTLGNRLIMLRAGEIVLNLHQEQKARLTVERLRQEFSPRAAHDQQVSM
jgi:putative ABC transport system ATP-binding protein